MADDKNPDPNRPAMPKPPMPAMPAPPAAGGMPKPPTPVAPGMPKPPTPAMPAPPAAGLPKPPAPAVPSAAVPVAPKPAAPAAAQKAPAAAAAIPANPVNPAALRPQPPKSGVSAEPAKADEKGLLLRRRDFVWHGVAGMLTLGAVAFGRFFFPRSLFEPRTSFTIGYASDYGFGVDTKFQSTQRIWVCRNSQGLFVILAVCTHLGCTPDWLATEGLFKCPCHGSVYDTEGKNFAGPAPMPMRRCDVRLDATGRIVVDTLTLYEVGRFNEGGPTGGAYIAV